MLRYGGIMLFWGVIIVGLVLLALRLIVGPAPAPERRPGDTGEPEAPEDPLDLLERDAPGALARYGTPEVAEMLESQGRGHELRGLGYKGGEE